MISQSFRKHSPRIAGTVGGLTFSLSVFASISFFTNMAHADWSSEKLYRGYNQSFGAFPPIDIDHRLSVSVEMTNRSAIQSTYQSAKQSANKPAHVESVIRSTRPVQPSAKGSSANQPPILSQRTYPQQRRPQQRAPQQGYQQPAYGVNNQRRSYNPQQNQNGNRTTGFNGPGFNGPWNNSGSGFSMPWGNNGSGFNPMANNMGNNMGSNKGNGGSWNW